MVSENSLVLREVAGDLQRVFGKRLQAVVAYGWQQRGPITSLALVDSLTLEDLDACATRVKKWARRGAAAPLLLTPLEFVRSLDAFPIEYGEIIAHHQVVFGADPFEGLSIRPEDMRRACEVQVKSHLLHLREDYLEAAGHAAGVAALVRESAPGFVALLRILARLNHAPLNSPGDLTRFATHYLQIDARLADALIALTVGDGDGTVDPIRLFPEYLATMERLADTIDRWRHDSSASVHSV
jgi:hypothetical protein